MSKVCNAVMVRKISATTMDGISIGIVICQNCCQRLAGAIHFCRLIERLRDHLQTSKQDQRHERG